MSRTYLGSTQEGSKGWHFDFKRENIANPSASHTAILVYNLLWSTGLVLLVTIMAIALRVTDIRRRAAWFLTAMSWAFTCISYLLLSGHQSDTQALPSISLCLLQASLIYSSPSLCTLAMVAFLYRSYLLISRISNEKIAQLTFKEAVMLNTIPLAVFAGTLYANIMVGLTHQSAIERDVSGLYCHLNAPQSKMITGGVSLAGVAAFYIIFGLIVRNLRRRPPSLNAKNILQAQGASLDIVIRMVIVSSMSVIVVMVASLQFIPSKSTIISDEQVALMQGSLPIFAAIILGSQRDMRRALTIRRRVIFDR